MSSVIEPSCRLLPYAVADGPHNMAADEAMLHAAAAGIASLRFYGWSAPTLSLGYFQPERLRYIDPQLAALPFVRRPTGGLTLVHDYELTYALALPAGRPWQPKQTGSLPWLCRMHGIIAAALRHMSVVAEAVECAGEQRSHDALCFRSLTPGDLVIGNAKVVGSAQRRLSGALLQHGAVLLAGSTATPGLPGIRETAGVSLDSETLARAVQDEWERQTDWPLQSGLWTDAELQHVEELVVGKYVLPAWNCKR